MKINDLILFLKYDNPVVRHNTKTDFYTDQDMEKVYYNVEKLIENLSEKFKEVI